MKDRAHRWAEKLGYFFAAAGLAMFITAAFLISIKFGFFITGIILFIWGAIVVKVANDDS